VPGNTPSTPAATALPRFRIVVATRGRPDDLARLLGLLAPQLEAHANFRLVVVNDASPSAAYTAAIAPFRHLLDYRVLPDRRGPGLARQAGLADGDEDYFITTDDDCLPDPDWLARTQALATAHPRVDLFAGTTRAVPSERPGIVERYIIASRRLPGAVEHPTKGLVMAVCAIMMCRREAFEAVGGFSPEIHGSSQDWNLTWRLLRNGCRYLVDRTWTVGHKSAAKLVETLRRHHRYGFGTAQHVLLEQDWEAARYRGNGGAADMVRQVWSAGVFALAEARRATPSLTDRWGQALIGAAAEAWQQWGWRRGLAHYGARYGRRLPRDVGLALANPLRASGPAPCPAASGAKSIRIVVPTYKRPDDLETFLEHMVPQIRGRANVRLVVVNDGSHDPAYQTVVDRFADAIDYRPQKVNRGPGLSRAIGYADATEDYLVFTDDDCMAPPGWLAWLEALIEGYPEVDLFAGKAMPVSSDRPGMVERFLTFTDKFPGPISTRRGLVIAMTANVACRRTAYVAARGYDPRMNTAGEDWNLTTRLLDSGASYRLCSEWLIGHKAQQGFRETLRRYYRYGWGGAQNIFLTGDWQGASELHSGIGVRDALKGIRNWLAGTGRSPEIAARALPVRLAYYALTVMVAAQYERGWLDGLRHYAKEYGRDIPRDGASPRRLASFVIDRPGGPAAEGE
jgi:glycosyltransferase involved in cell wall biosynthesis